MSEDKKSKPGFLFNIISDTGNGHQIQASFNLPEGASKEQIDAAYDLVFDAHKRQAARIRAKALEMEVGMAEAKVKGQHVAIKRLAEAPQLNGKRRSQDEASYQQALASVDADEALLELKKKSLEATYKEAGYDAKEIECLTQRAS